MHLSSESGERTRRIEDRIEGKETELITFYRNSHFIVLLILSRRVPFFPLAAQNLFTPSAYNVERTEINVLSLARDTFHSGRVSIVFAGRDAILLAHVVEHIL